MAATEHAFQAARWLRDLIRFLPLKSQFVLTGNVRDLQVAELAPGLIGPQPLMDNLAATFHEAGYQQVITYEPLTGFRYLGSPSEPDTESAAALTRLGLIGAEGQQAGISGLAGAIERLVIEQTAPTALIIDFASRLVARPSDLSASEHELFTRTLMLSHRARARPVGHGARPFFNTLVWIIEREGDLPDWLLYENPRIRHISLSKPDRHARQSVAGALLKPLAGVGTSAEAIKQAEDAFTDGTEGMLLLDMNAIAVLARVEGVRLEQIRDAVRRYKVGVTEDPWLKLDQDKIHNAESFVRQRVKGQQPAVTHMLDIVKRAMTGVGSGRRGNRPRGVAFLAGPTGVGKTELAKTITSLLFGDESAYIRFDMSEFSAEHADQRLLGAPPGYIGYDVGGELTNAIRERPFSVVLFDEIEKAHPRVLDKFLQILDDGVLTSGRGDRVYFSEALIVFTSNLGIYRLDERGERVLNVAPDEPYQVVRERVLEQIQRHFKFVLNRPEILNRIGENVIVFDFVRPQVADEIFTHMVQSIVEDLRAQQRDVTIEPQALRQLRELCVRELSNGGRGIRNQLETHLLNPLARALFDERVGPGQACRIVGLDDGCLQLTKE